MSRKRSLEIMTQSTVSNEHQAKRTMTIGYEVQNSVEFKLPVQQQELGRFWIDSYHKATPVKPVNHHQQACGPTCNSAGWEDRQLSISLAQQSPRAFAETEEIDMQDTATSSGSSSSGKMEQRAAATGDRQASAAPEANEEDSISSHQALPTAHSPVLFTTATPCPEVDADLSSLYCWEDLHSLLAEVQ